MHQKRKSMSEPGEPAAKRSRTQIKAVIREKAVPKPKAKKAKQVKAARPKKQRDSPAPEPGDRRRSSRVTKTSDYKERDDKDDEDEMLDGVAEWKYGAGDDSDEEEDSDEVESGDEGEEDEEEEEEEEEEKPAARNGRRIQMAKPAIKASVLASVRKGGRSKRSSRGDDMDTDD